MFCHLYRQRMIFLRSPCGCFTRSHFLNVDQVITSRLLMTLCIHHLDYLTSQQLHCCSLIFEFLYKCYLFWIIYRNCVNVGPVIAFRFQALFTSSLLQPSNSVYYLLVLTRSFEWINDLFFIGYTLCCSFWLGIDKCLDLIS